VSEIGAVETALNSFGGNLNDVAPKLNSVCAFFKQMAGKNARFVSDGGITYAPGNSTPAFTP